MEQKDSDKQNRLCKKREKETFYCPACKAYRIPDNRGYCCSCGNIICSVAEANANNN